MYNTWQQTVASCPGLLSRPLVPSSFFPSLVKSLKAGGDSHLCCTASLLLLILYSLLHFPEVLKEELSTLHLHIAILGK